MTGAAVNNKNAKGTALLVVLFIVMAVSLISMGFIARSDRELACGANMETRMQMDYMAEAGLTHAKNFIINPQSVYTETVGYWQGDTRLQIESSDDYYDISVTRDTSDSTDHCDYTIVSQAYRLDGADKISQSTLTGQLRLDPCIALWVGNTYTSETQTTVNGDIYCGGVLKGVADINGDAFAAMGITATNIEGDSNANVAAGSEPVSFPDVDYDDLIPTYRIGSTTYSATQLPSYDMSLYYNSQNMSNPAGIYYYNGDLTLSGSVYIRGTLIVTGNLIIKGASNWVMRAKVSYNSLDTNDYPAVIVGGKIYIMELGQFYAEGLVQVGNEIEVYSNCYNSCLLVVGGLFIHDGNIDINGGSSTNIRIEVTAAPELTAIQYRRSSGDYFRWNSVGGSFFKAISR